MAEELDALSRKQKAQFWGDHIRAWQDTDLSQAAYCRQNDLVRHRFWYWRNRMDAPSSKGVSFVPVALPPDRIGRAPRTVSVITPNGYKIELGSSFDPNLIGQLMHTIRDL